MIEAHHREAIKGQILDEAPEGILDRIEGLEMIEMLGIDIGDDRDIGRQLQESAVAFVGFDHHPIAGAKPRIGAIGVDDPAIDDGRIEFAGFEQRRDKRRRRRLAMRAGDGDALLQAASAPRAFRRGVRPAGAARAQRRVRDCRA